MLKKEHIRQAIKAIFTRNPDIGYTLDEMLSAGRITLVKTLPESSSEGDFHFLFDGIPVTIRRIIFFNAGTAPIEERLLIKYGEMTRKQQFAVQTSGMNYQKAARDIRGSGIRFMVRHEIDSVIAGLKKHVGKSGPGLDIPKDGSAEIDALSDETGKWQQVIHEFQSLKTRQHDLSAYLPPGKCDAGSGLCFRGAVNRDAPALFVRFPFCMDALMQVADLNLEFFHVRFLLSCLSKGLGGQLFACIVDNRIEGMVYLTVKKSYFYRVVEIHYIATVRGRPGMETKAVKGVGTLLLAGVWMVWKTEYREEKDLLLDSEVGARSFYEAMGFQSRGFSEFALKHPRGKLAKAILDMASRCPDLPGGVVGDITLIVKEQFRILRKRGRRQHSKIKRQLALESIHACFQAGANAALLETAMRELKRYQKAIPELADLLRPADGGK